MKILTLREAYEKANDVINQRQNMYEQDAGAWAYMEHYVQLNHIQNAIDLKLYRILASNIYSEMHIDSLVDIWGYKLCFDRLWVRRDKDEPNTICPKSILHFIHEFLYAKTYDECEKAFEKLLRKNRLRKLNDNVNYIWARGGDKISD